MKRTTAQLFGLTSNIQVPAVDYEFEGNTHKRARFGEKGTAGYDVMLRESAAKQACAPWKSVKESTPVID